MCRSYNYYTNEHIQGEGARRVKGARLPLGLIRRYNGKHPSKFPKKGVLCGMLLCLGILVQQNPDPPPASSVEVLPACIPPLKAQHSSKGSLNMRIPQKSKILLTIIFSPGGIKKKTEQKKSLVQKYKSPHRKNQHNDKSNKKPLK